MIKMTKSSLAGQTVICQRSRDSGRWEWPYKKEAGPPSPYQGRCCCCLPASFTRFVSSGPHPSTRMYFCLADLLPPAIDSQCISEKSWSLISSVSWSEIKYNITPFSYLGNTENFSELNIDKVVFICIQPSVSVARRKPLMTKLEHL